MSCASGASDQIRWTAMSRHRSKSPPLSKNALARLVAVFTFMAASSADPVHAQQQPAPVAEYTIAPEGLIVKTPAGARTLTLPDCAPKAIIRDGAQVYVACGASGILLLDATNPQA